MSTIAVRWRCHKCQRLRLDRVQVPDDVERPIGYGLKPSRWSRPPEMWARKTPREWCRHAYVRCCCGDWFFEVGPGAGAQGSLPLGRATEAGR